MLLEITKNIYEHKYQDALSYNNYLEHVEHGFQLLNHHTTGAEVEELEDMNKALEYNMEVMLKHLM